MANAIALVLDPNFGDKVALLAQRMPVWIVASPANVSTVNSIRPDFKEGHLTTLLTFPGECPADILLRALRAIEEHHGIYSQADPYDEIEVYGTKELPGPKPSAELNFKSVLPTSFGFRIEK